MVIHYNWTRERAKVCDVPRFPVRAQNKLSSGEEMESSVLELLADIKIDKDIRLLLRQEMKEMD